MIEGVYTMTIDVNIDTVIDIVKPIALFVAGVVTEALRRWIAAPRKERMEFIDVSADALKDGRITVGEGFMIVKEGKDVFIGVDLATMTDDTMGKA